MRSLQEQTELLGGHIGESMHFGIGPDVTMFGAVIELRAEELYTQSNPTVDWSMLSDDDRMPYYLRAISGGVITISVVNKE